MTATKDELKAKVVDLHLAGLPVNKIAEIAGVTVTRAKALIREAVNDRVPEVALPDETRTEIARLDTMLFGLWPQARRGNVESVDRVLAISERRDRVANPKKNTHALREAFDASITKSKDVKDVDAGLIELGRQYADRIDEAMAHARGEELTKALYLGPHILGVLKEALATPASRAAASKDKEESVNGKLAQLRSITSKSKTGA